MSLLSGMNNMLENTVAMEAAADDILFHEEIVMESDEIIDTMVDGKHPILDEEIDAAVDDDFSDLEEDALEGDILSASEAAALTGNDFFSSLRRNSDDPISTRPGSIGYQPGTASFGTNFSSDFRNSDDPISTRPGSIGYQPGTANYKENYSNTRGNSGDPIATFFGSIGQKSTVAKDPSMRTMESSIDALMGRSSIATEGKLGSKKEAKRAGALSVIGVKDLNKEAVQSAISSGNFDQAISMVKTFGHKVETGKAKLIGKPDSKPTISVLNGIIKSNDSLMLSIKRQESVSKYKSAGMNGAKARLKANADIRKKAKGHEPAKEAYINECLDLIIAYESEVLGIDDVEETSDGSIGQKSSVATHEENFNEGKPNNDPINTRDGSEGQKDTKASFEKNFSDGILDDFDPVAGKDGTIGQRDTTAKDPASESSTLDAELEFLENNMLDDFDE